MSERSPIWLAAGLRTPFVRVDGPFAAPRRARALGSGGPGDGAAGLRPDRLRRLGLRRPQPRLQQPRARGLARGRARSARARATRRSCSAARAWSAPSRRPGLLALGRAALALVGGVESMSRVQIGLGQNLSDWLRRVGQARGLSRKLAGAAALRLRDLRLYVPEVKNRATGKSMGEHCEEMARDVEDRPARAGRARPPEPPAHGRGAGARLLRRPHRPAGRRRRRTRSRAATPRSRSSRR